MGQSVAQSDERARSTKINATAMAHDSRVCCAHYFFVGVGIRRLVPRSLVFIFEADLLGLDLALGRVRVASASAVEVLSAPARSSLESHSPKFFLLTVPIGRSRASSVKNRKP